MPSFKLPHPNFRTCKTQQHLGLKRRHFPTLLILQLLRTIFHGPPRRDINRDNGYPLRALFWGRDRAKDGVKRGSDRRMEGEAEDGVENDVGRGGVVGLERFGRGEGGDVEVLALLEKTLIDVSVAWLSRTSGLRYWLACVRADEEGCSPLAGKLSVHSQTCLKDDRFVSITGNSFLREHSRKCLAATSPSPPYREELSDPHSLDTGVLTATSGADTLKHSPDSPDRR